VAGSPVLRVLSVSMTSIRSSGLPHLGGLSDPTNFRLNRMDLPCSRQRLLVACWRYEPREHLRPLAKTRPLIPPSPLSDRVGYSDHVRFRGYFPVHCIPAYNLPVYASQWPLPEHHARLGTRLLARLYRGRHRRRQTSTRFQGATLIKPDVPISGIRLSDWLHREARDGAVRGRRWRHRTPSSR
jgi:hypothetical protein